MLNIESLTTLIRLHNGRDEDARTDRPGAKKDLRLSVKKPSAENSNHAAPQKTAAHKALRRKGESKGHSIQ